VPETETYPKNGPFFAFVWQTKHFFAHATVQNTVLRLGCRTNEGGFTLQSQTTGILGETENRAMPL
jgi:hypothetical protein